MTIILIVIGFILLTMELLTTSTIFIWLAFGFLGAAIASLFTANLLLIMFLGAIATALSVIFLKNKYIKIIRPINSTKTSYQSYLGTKIKLSEDYVNDGVSQARVTINGVDWNAVSTNEGDSFKADEYAKIVRIEGAKVIIEKLGEK